ALAIRREAKVIGADRADTELALARALQAAGRDARRARSLAESARADYVAAGKKDEALAAAGFLTRKLHEGRLAGEDVRLGQLAAAGPPADLLDDPGVRGGGVGEPPARGLGGL